MIRNLLLTAALFLSPAFAQQAVEVVNGPKQPIPVQQQPAEVFVKTFFFTYSGLSNYTLMTVPARKRLVVESVSAYFSGGNQASHEVVGVAISHGLSNVQHYIAPTSIRPTPGGNPGNQMIMTATHNVRWYFEPGASITADILKSTQFFAVGGGITFSGYLVDVP